ncbi:MAG: flippase [Candidatus Ratteibacteria bacterium]|nr:flippase [Candidatus Ratteibacteria bacterium]
MKTNGKNIYFRRLGLVGASGIVLMVSGIILMPIMTKTLPVEDYGRWVQLLTVLRIGFILSEMGISIAMLRFLPSETDKTKISDQFHTTLATILTLNLLASAVLLISPQTVANYLFGGKTELVYCIQIILPIVGINTVCLYYFRAKNQIKKYTLFTNLQAYLIVAIVGALVITYKNIMFAVAGYTLAQLVIFWIMFVIIVKEIGINAPNTAYLKSYFKFGLPILSSNITDIILGNSDRVLIGIFLSMASIGYYNAAYTIGFALMFLATPFTTVLPQTLINLYDHGKIIETKEETAKAIKYFLYLAIPAGIIVSLFGETILKIITTKEIAQESSYLIPFFVISAIISGSQGILSNYLLVIKETQLLLLIKIIAAITALALSLILIPKIGLIGAMVSMIVANTIQFSITAHRIWREKT